MVDFLSSSRKKSTYSVPTTYLMWKSPTYTLDLAERSIKIAISVFALRKIDFFPPYHITAVTRTCFANYVSLGNSERVARGKY